MALTTIPPDYFREAARKYSSSEDRKTWLTGQIAIADQSLLAYQQELNRLAAEYYRIAGMKGSAGLVTAAGGVLAAIPLGYTQVVGGVLMVSSSFFAKIENKQKNQMVEQNRQVGIKVFDESLKVAAYRQQYKSELLWLKLIPMILAFFLVRLITK